MDIDDLESLAERVHERYPDVQGPAFTDHGYIATRTLTFWSGDRRVHFYFHTDRGTISVLCEAAEVKPKRRAVMARLTDDDQAYKVVDRFLRKKKSFDDLPDVDWAKEGPHDELVSHPPDQPSPTTSVGLVGKMDKKKGGGDSARRAETKRTEIVTRIMSRPAGVTGLGGVTIYAKSPDTLAAWYREKLGLPLKREGGTWTAPLGDATLTIVESAGKGTSGLRVMFSLRVSSFEAFVEQAALKGVDIEALDQSAGGRYAYVRDPEGNPVELWSGGSI